MKKITWAAAVAALTISIGSGMYQQRSLIEVFSRFGLDLAIWNDPRFFTDAAGRFVVMYEDDGSAGYWINERPSQVDQTSAATIWINGAPFTWLADGTIGGQSGSPAGVEVYPNAADRNYRAWISPPEWINVRARWDLYAQTVGQPEGMSGEVFIRFSTCAELDSGLWVPPRVQPANALHEYEAELEMQIDGAWVVIERSILMPGGHQNWKQGQGLFRLYFYVRDQLGGRGPRFGPIEFAAGSPCIEG